VSKYAGLALDDKTKEASFFNSSIKDLSEEITPPDKPNNFSINPFCVYSIKNVFIIVAVYIYYFV
jgi:hypothetical protein